MKLTANGKRQTVGSCVSQKHENLRFPACPALLRSYSIYLGNRQGRSLNESSFSLFWQKENFILPFAVNIMLNLLYILSHNCDDHSLLNLSYVKKLYHGACARAARFFFLIQPIKSLIYDAVVAVAIVDTTRHSKGKTAPLHIRLAINLIVWR